MRFKVRAAEVIKALNTVSNVTPQALLPQGGAGYLFKTFIKDGEPRCHIYSRDRNEVARADISLLELDEEGSFIAPLKILAGLQYIEETDLNFEVKSEGEFMVSLKPSAGGWQEEGSFDPQYIKPLDNDFEAAGKMIIFPSGILREAISLSKKFLADVKDGKAEEHLKTISIFDDSNEAWAKGNGNLFTSNGTKAFYFASEAFENKGIAIHGAHLDRVVTFLGKCSGDVEIRYGKNMMYAVNAVKDSAGKLVFEQVFGWAYHSKTHSKFSYYPFKIEMFILRVAKVTLLNALNFTRSKMEPNRDKIRIHFSTEKEQLTFTVGEGTLKGDTFPVPVKVELKEDTDFQYNVNIEQLIELVDGVKGNEVMLRVAPVKPDERRPKGAAMFRTIDDFWMDADGKVVGGSGAVKDAEGNEKRPDGGFKCRVTRFMPSKE